MARRPLWTGDELASLFAAPGFVTDVTGISIDSRSVNPGDLFIALSGDPGTRFGGGQGGGRDGHDFAVAAVNAGASAVLAHRDIDVDAPVLQVSDTLDALWSLGTAAVDRSNSQRVAITGSSGKTTMRGWLEGILAEVAPTHASTGSLNNHWGVPLSLARMPASAAFGVFEVGTNHPGEISPLSSIVSPDVSLLLNVLPAHIGNFPSMAALREEKLSICDGLGDGGVLVLPAALAGQVKYKAILTFGERGADVWASDVVMTGGRTVFTAHVSGERVDCSLPFTGPERLDGALALLATCSALGVSPARAAGSLHRLGLPVGRGNLVEVAGIVITDDSYNANPASMRMAIDALQRTGADGRKIALLGEMLELGDMGAAAHLEVAAATAGLDRVVSAGAGFRDVSFPVPYQHVDNPDDIDLKTLAAGLAPGDHVLVKGSNRVFWQRDFVDRLVAELRRIHE